MQDSLDKIINNLNSKFKENQQEAIKDTSNQENHKTDNIDVPKGIDDKQKVKNPEVTDAANSRVF